MLKDPRCQYIRRRHPGILKSKLVNTYDLKIVGFIEGLGRYPFYISLSSSSTPTSPSLPAPSSLLPPPLPPSLVQRKVLINDRLKDSLGALKLQSANKREVSVGSGFSEKQREDLWKIREELLGKIVEISAQELTKNSLRFPVFVKFREDKAEPDVI